MERLQNDLSKAKSRLDEKVSCEIICFPLKQINVNKSNVMFQISGK